MSDSLRELVPMIPHKYDRISNPGIDKLVGDVHSKDCPRCMGDRILAAEDDLVKKWRRFARADCDPANGSATAQAGGRVYAACADELEAREAIRGDNK